MVHPIIVFRYKRSVSDFRIRKAFTLIEMLVVIAIIGILASMLMPLLMSARDSAKSLSCQNNLRQFGMCLNSYVMDNNNFLPPLRYEQSDGTLTLFNQYLVPDYMNSALLECPSQVEHLTYSGWWQSHPDYGYNMRLALTNAGYKLSKIKSPSRKWALSDVWQFDNSGLGTIDESKGNYRWYPTAASSFKTQGYGGIAGRHSGFANIMHLDISVERYEIPIPLMPHLIFESMSYFDPRIDPNY